MSAPRLGENPFAVLDLTSDATRTETERAAQKLLAMLAVGHGSVASYATPLGPRPRTEALVRTAVAALRDPDQRLLAELAWTPPAEAQGATAAAWAPYADVLARRRPCFP